MRSRRSAMVEVVGDSVRQREAEQEQALRSIRGPRYEAAELGFRHYWYPALLGHGYVFCVIVSAWRCNWRAAVENGHDAAHAPMVPMNSLRWRTSLNLPPAWYGYVDNVLEGQYLHRRARTVGGASDYPVVG